LRGSRILFCLLCQSNLARIEEEEEEEENIQSREQNKHTNQIQKCLLAILFFGNASSTYTITVTINE
jgi:hypothetical protein